jgi:hypothetical protein
MFVGSFTLVLPYFPTGTAERVSQAFATEPTPFVKHGRALGVCLRTCLKRALIACDMFLQVLSSASAFFCW